MSEDTEFRKTGSGFMEPRDQLKTLLREHMHDKPFSELAPVTFDHRGAALIGHIMLDTLEEQGYFRADVPLSYDLQDALHTACERYSIDYPVALGLIEVESNFQPNIVNATGDCYGLCQLNVRYFPSGLPPEENIDHGLAYLREQIDRYGSLEAGLQAYHDGYDTGARWYARAVLEAAEKWRWFPFAVERKAIHDLCRKPNA